MPFVAVAPRGLQSGDWHIRRNCRLRCMCLHLIWLVPPPWLDTKKRPFATWNNLAKIMFHGSYSSRTSPISTSFALSHAFRRSSGSWAFRRQCNSAVSPCGLNLTVETSPLHSFDPFLVVSRCHLRGVDPVLKLEKGQFWASLAPIPLRDCPFPPRACNIED